MNRLLAALLLSCLPLAAAGEDLATGDLGLVIERASGTLLLVDRSDRAAVARIERLLMLAEYKRRQAPPGVKLSTRNFGRDRRYPITHGFRTG